MKLKLAILSAGLGNITRGFEVSAATWYDELKNQRELNVKLYTGGAHKNAERIWNLPRNGFIINWFKKLHLVNDGVKLEQFSFALGYIFHLIRFKPNVVWLQEYSLACLILKFRNVFGLNFKIMFCDGAPIGYEYIKKFDFLIFLHQFHLEEAIRSGADISRCKVIPHITLWPDTYIGKKYSRDFFSINHDSFVIICVAAWNKHHKRIDYLLNEYAKLQIENSLLLLCGQTDLDTNSLKEIASDLKINVKWCTLNQQELSVAYMASDIFVLPSLHEGLGAVLIEAGAHELPVICHPYEAAKFIFGENYLGLTDISIDNNLSRKILSYKQNNNLHSEGKRTYEIIKTKFNKGLLTRSFLEFVEYASRN